MIRNVLFSAFAMLIALHSTGQQITPIKGKTALKGTVNISSGEPDFDPQLQQLEALPSPAGDYKQKKILVDEIRKNTPRPAPAASIQAKNGKEAPLLSIQFQGNNAGGTPNDNDVAVGNNGMIISVLNSNIRIFDSTGKILASKSLASLARSLGTLTRTFDPRVVYDPNNDRFIVVFLNGSESTTNNPVICFSETSDPTGNWHCYLLPGNPLSDTSWSDYPIISLSDKDLFLTLNLLQDNKGWKDGFRQSVIWQVDLEKGYNGDTLEHQLWTGIKFQDKPVWNICPAQAGMKPEGPFTYFLSLRPGDIQNDTLFLHTITGSVSGNNTRISTRLLKTSQKYGLPPSAPQPDGQLMETNDARVLTAMVQNGLIHFAGNTRDFTRNSAGIYYGIMAIDDPVANLKILSFDTLDVGYPDIAYGGTGDKNDQAVMITFSHVSPTAFPGTSVVSINWTGEFSGVTRVKAGVKNTNVLLDTFERWGDYAGIQRKYNEKNVFWLAGNYGDGINRTIIARVYSGNPALYTPGLDAGVREMVLYPNPAPSYFEVTFELSRSEKLLFTVYDMQGKEVQVLLQDMVKGGTNRFRFSTAAMAPGAYVLHVKGESGIVHQSKFVVSR